MFALLMLDFETQFESQAAAIMAAAGITATITKIRSASNVPTLDVAYKFEVGSALASAHGKTPNGKYHHNIYDGTLEITLFANRDDDANPASSVYAQFALLRRQIAAAFLEGLWPFNTVSPGLPYLDTQSGWVRPAGRRAGLSEDKEQDLCVMAFHVRFGIPAACWPTAS
jgi:hypothetical protein